MESAEFRKDAIRSQLQHDAAHKDAMRKPVLLRYQLPRVSSSLIVEGSLQFNFTV